MNRFYKDQSGAVTLLVLAAILITLMLALVVFDTTLVSRQKIEVQTAADTAAWSQSAVEARAMNMLAFANVGKRIIMGMGVYYQAIWLAWAELWAGTALVLIVAGIVCVAGVIFAGTCGVDKIIEHSAKILTEITIIMGQEALDEFYFLYDVRNKIKQDVESFDAYQKYQSELTPWWSWAEGMTRGARNGASAVGLFPVPARELPELDFIEVGSEITDKLPVRKAFSAHQMCLRSIAPDLAIHMADYIVKNQLCEECVKDKVTDNGVRRIMHGFVAGLAALQYPLVCLGLLQVGIGQASTPYQMYEFSNPSEWLLASSNLAISYRAGRDMSGKHRDKYRYLTKDYSLYDIGGLREELYKSDGQFGVSRSEISFQGGVPDLWHSSWSARMRPVALPDEWDGYPGDTQLITAYNDTLPFLVVGAEQTAAMSMVDNDNYGESVSYVDFARGFMAFEAFSNSNLPGLTR